MRSKVLKEKVKRIGTAAIASAVMMSSTVSLPVIVMADELPEQTEQTEQTEQADTSIPTLESLEADISNLENDILNYETQTDGLGMIMTIYQAAVDDLKELLDNDETTKAENLESLVSAIDTKLETLEARLASAKETEASEMEISNIENMISLHEGYLKEISSLENILEVSMSDPDVYDILLEVLYTGDKEVADTKTQHEEIMDEYYRIMQEFNTFESSYTANCVGYAGVDPEGNTVVYLNGEPYIYDEDAYEIRNDLNEEHNEYHVYSTGDFQFYVALDGIHVLNDGSETVYETTLGDCVRALRERLYDAIDKIELYEERPTLLGSKLDTLNTSIEEIDLGLNEEVVANLSDETFALIEKYTELKQGYTAIKSAIYSGEYSSDMLGDLKLGDVIGNLEEFSTDIDNILIEMATAVAEENLSTKDMAAINSYMTNLNTVKGNIDDDIATFKLIQGSGDTAAEISDLLKRIELLEKTNEDLESSTSAASLASLTAKVNTLTSQNSTLTSKVNTLTSSNSSLTSQLNSLKSSSSATKTTASTTGTTTKTTSSSTPTTSTTTAAKTTTSTTAATATKTSSTPTTSTTATSAKTTASTGTTTTASTKSEIPVSTASVKSATVTTASNTGIGETIPTTFASAPVGDANDVDSFNFTDNSAETQIEAAEASNGYAGEGNEAAIEVEEATQPEKTNTALIAAIVVAGILLVGIIGFAVWFFKLRKPSMAEFDEDDEDEFDDDDEDLDGVFA